MVYFATTTVYILKIRVHVVTRPLFLTSTKELPHGMLKVNTNLPAAFPRHHHAANVFESNEQTVIADVISSPKTRVLTSAVLCVSAP